MNLYIIVEGDKTEMQVYPAWLKHLTPQLQRIYNAWDVSNNNFYLLSGGGIPSIYNHIANSIQDIHSINKNSEYKYDVLMVCIDTEEENREYIQQKIDETLREEHIAIGNIQLIVCEHKVCMESWFLGNRAIFKDNPQSQLYREYINFYNVSNMNPELMGTIDVARFNKAHFHYRYLQEMCHERHTHYSKTDTQEVEKETYLNQLIQRYQTTNHLQTFGQWYEFISSIK